MERTHSEQDPGVEPPLHQEGHVEVDEEEGVDAQPHQLRTSKHNFHFSSSKTWPICAWALNFKRRLHIFAAAFDKTEMPKEN